MPKENPMNAPPNPAERKTNANQTPAMAGVWYYLREAIFPYPTVQKEQRKLLFLPVKPRQNDNIPVNNDAPNTETNHTPAVAGVWFYTRSSFPPNEYVPETPPTHLRTVRKTGSRRIEFEAPEMKTTDSRNPQMTCTTVNRQAKPAQMATDELGEPPSKPQGSNAQYHMPPSAGVWYKSLKEATDGTTPALAGVPPPGVIIPNKPAWPAVLQV
ncbi:hypothetical protein BS47DRAFT_1365468 [Hydnum rufescens UP504]|uniref:Uncharacterized protein n=1 Tax=Hydnum rufescens UP504 TaxID=1448309 RepID=A0A9P6AQL2_9AGAM|nr:hypothetical protein BS47DRAFT_1365468 [Hydnum rufescens UP504]